MHNLQPCARRAHKHPIIDIYLPIVGRIYPIPEYIRQLLAEYIQYQNISPNCWQNISNTRIYLPIVGRIYPISEYIPNFWQNISDTRIYLYWIYTANNWEYMNSWIYSVIGYILPTIGRYILVMDIFCQQLGDICQLWGVCAQGCRLCIYWNVYLFFKKIIFCNSTPSNWHKSSNC